MNKKLKARLLDGSVWSFPLEVLAKERALSYAAEGTDVYNEEYVWALSEDSEMYDWIMNNTDVYEYEGWTQEEVGNPPFSQRDLLEYCFNGRGRIQDCFDGKYGRTIWIE